MLIIINKYKLMLNIYVIDKLNNLNLSLNH